VNAKNKFRSVQERLGRFSNVQKINYLNAGIAYVNQSIYI